MNAQKKKTTEPIKFKVKRPADIKVQIEEVRNCTWCSGC